MKRGGKKPAEFVRTLEEVLSYKFGKNQAYMYRTYAQLEFLNKYAAIIDADEAMKPLFKTRCFGKYEI